MKVIDIIKEAQAMEEVWVPKQLAATRNVALRIARLRGSYHWHVHKDEDEIFYILSGVVFVDTDTGSVELKAGQALVVPKGIRHRSRVDAGDALVLLIEPESTITTGESWQASV